MAHYDDCEPDCTVAPLHLARHLPGCGMTRPLRNEADVLAAAQARVSRPSAERDAITALVNWRRMEQGGVDFEALEWHSALGSVRDAADRLIEVEAYQVTEAASEQIVRDHVEVFDLPGPLLENRRDEVARRARRYDRCDEMCTTDCGHCKGNYSEVRQARQAARVSVALTEHEAGVDAFVSRPEFGGGL
jgi:hypothetical protein